MSRTVVVALVVGSWASIAGGACGPHGPTTAPTAAGGPVRAARLVDASPTALAVDGAQLFYADLTGVFAVALDGGTPRRITDTDRLVTRIVVHGDQLLLGLEGELLAVAKGGGAVTSRYAGDVVDFAVDGDGLWIVDGTTLRAVPDTGASRVVAAELGAVAALATDGDAVYVAVPAAAADAVGAPTMAGAPPVQAIWRVAKQGGARTRLARRQYGVAGMIARDGELWWTSAGAGLRHVAVGGGPIRTALGGGGVALAADDLGFVVTTSTGLLIEVRGAGAHVITLDAAHAPEASPPLVLGGGGLVALVTDHAAAASAVWRLPRPWTGAATVAGWVTDRLAALAMRGDDLIVLDALLDADAPGRILRIDPRGGRRVLATATGLDQLAVDGATVGYLAGATLWRIDGDAAPVQVVTLAADEPVIGLTLAGDRFYWADGGRIRTVGAHGGEVTTLWEDSVGHAGSGRPSAGLRVAGGVVFASSLGWGASAVTRVDGPGAARTLFEPAEGYLQHPLAAVGDALFVVVDRALWQVPQGGGAARAVVAELPGDLDALVGAGARLVVALRGDGATAASVDLARGTLTPLFTARDEGELVLAGAPGRVYLGLPQADLILRYPTP